MSHSVTISDSVASVAALLRAGNLRAAREQWAVTLTAADDTELAALLECGRILASYPRTGTTLLRGYWQRATDPRVRAVIEACAPRPEDQPTREPQPAPEDGPRWDRHSIQRARASRRRGGTVTRSRNPQARRDRRQRRQAAQSLALHLSYTDTEDGPAPDTTTQRPSGGHPGHAIDYERLAVDPAAQDRDSRDPRRTAVRGNGRPCVALGCHVEPSRADRQQHDGLCGECRDAGRPGIQVPDDANRAQMLEALCAYIWEHYPAALNHLRQEWARHTGTDRDTIAAWVTTHVPDTDKETAKVVQLAACATCAAERGPRDLRQQPADDGQCASCRTLDNPPAPENAATASAAERVLAAA